MLCAPALAKSATCCSGRSTIRWTSYSTPSKPWSTSALSTCGPIDSGGTKWPSMTSTWITRAPACTTSATCAPSRAKSAARMLGAIRGAGVVICRAAPYGTGSDLDEHRAAAVVAHRRGRRRHPHDGAVLAAVGADGPQLEAVQAVDAPVAAGQRRGTQPGLTATGALQAELLGLQRHLRQQYRSRRCRHGAGAYARRRRRRSPRAVRACRWSTR